MNFNQYQLQNVRILTPDVVGVIQKRQWKDASTALLVCTGCGKRNITGPIVSFFKYKGENLLCYQCQASQMPLAQPLAARIESAKPPVTRKQDNTMITDRQAALLRTLIIEKVLNEGERERRLSNLHELTKAEAITAIGILLKNHT